MANVTYSRVDYNYLHVYTVHVSILCTCTRFMSIMDQSIPKTTLPTKRNVPWLSKELILITPIQSRNLAYKRAKRTGILQHFLLYKSKRNKLSKLLMKKAKAKFQYFWKIENLSTKKNTTIPLL